MLLSLWIKYLIDVKNWSLRLTDGHWKGHRKFFWKWKASLYHMGYEAYTDREQQVNLTAVLPVVIHISCPMSIHIGTAFWLCVSIAFWNILPISFPTALSPHCTMLICDSISELYFCLLVYLNSSNVPSLFRQPYLTAFYKISYLEFGILYLLLTKQMCKRLSYLIKGKIPEFI